MRQPGLAPAVVIAASALAPSGTAGAQGFDGSALTVDSSTLSDVQAVAGAWRALEDAAPSHFFRGWTWLGTLLEHLPGDHRPDVLRVSQGQTTIALALVWQRRQRRHRGLIRPRALHLNESGIADFDRVTVEHNGLLCVPGAEAAAVAAAVRHLRLRPAWDELELGGLTTPQHQAWHAAASGCGLGFRERWTKPYFFIDLQAARVAGKDYLEALGPNTRYQARRSMRLYAQQGTLVCERPESLAQALDWLERLAALHQAQWQARGQAGAFATAYTRHFHQRLVETGWPRGEVDLLHVRAGDRTLGYVYNFVADDVTYNYQSGHVAESDPKLKAGLACHCIAVDDALRRGMATYDLLMGGEHFKASLTTGRGVMHWSTLQMPRLSLRLENGLRRLRDRMRERDAAARQDADALAAGSGGGDAAP